MKTMKVKNIKKVGIGRVLNLTVDKNHTFVTENGITTHNCDYLTPSAQSVLRGIIERFSSNCSFIFTANFPNRIIDPIHSRTVGVEFKIKQDEKPVMQAQLFKRVVDILKNENVEYDNEVLVTVINKFYPDNRKVLNQFQQYANGGSIDSGILMELEEVSIESLMKAIANKKFKEIRQWSAENKDNDLTAMYGRLYKELKNFVSPGSIPEAILIINDYQRYDAVVPDKEIHITAMCLEMGIQLEFK